MDQEFIYSFEEKDYPVKVTYKRIKNIHYRFDGESFIVSAPRRISNSFIKSGLDKYAKKLIKRNVKVNAEGDDYLYLLGEKVDIVYPGEIYFSNGLIIDYKDHNDLHKKLKKWFLEYLKERTEYYAKIMHAPAYLVKLRQMRSRYGSNNKDKRIITYSLTLLHYSTEIIDSVIIHELTHCFVYDHSDKFYRLLYKYCPNYDMLRKKLIKAVFK